MEKEISSAGPEDSKARLDRLKHEKARLGRLVGSARDSDHVVEKQWISELSDVSREIKYLQKLLKQQLNGVDPAKKWYPQAITPPDSIKNKALGKSITIESFVSAKRSAVDEYIGRHPGATVWHQPLIVSFIEQAYGHRSRYLCAFTESGELVGVLPVIQLKSRLFGNFMVSMPFFNYGAVLADNAQIARDLIRAADQWRQEEGAKHLELRFLQDNRLGLAQRTDKITFWLPLPGRSDDLWSSFKPKVRAQIRRGEREMSGFMIGGEELLDEFYRVFSRNMRDLGTPVYGRDFFQGLLATLEGQAWLAVVRINGRPAGCAFLVGYQERMEIPWASTLRAYSHTGINMVMYWKILDFAIKRRFKVFDFGRCTEGSGTHKFKKQWGAQPIRLYWDYVLSGTDGLPALNPDNPKFRLLVAVWRKLPVWVTNFLGPRIVKFLP